MTWGTKLSTKGMESSSAWLEPRVQLRSWRQRKGHSGRALRQRVGTNERLWKVRAGGIAEEWKMMTDEWRNQSRALIKRMELILDMLRSKTDDIWGQKTYGTRERDSSLGWFPGFLLDNEVIGVATDCRNKGKRGIEEGLVRNILKLCCLWEFGEDK